MTILQTSVWAVNELGEIVLQSGKGSMSPTGFTDQNAIPTDTSSGKAVVRFPEEVAQFKTSSAGFTGLSSSVNGKFTPFNRPVRLIGVIGDSVTNLCEAFGMQFGSPAASIPGVCVSDVPYASLATASGTGVLTYNASAKTLTWQAPTDQTGLPVKIEDGVFTLYSANTAFTLKVTVTGRLLTNTNSSASIVSGTRMWKRDAGSYIHVADSLTRGRFTFLPNFGIGGNRSTDLSLRYNQVLDAGSDLVIDQSGTNDIVAAGMTVAASVAARAANWDKALARGIPVIVMLISPRWGLTASGVATGDTARYTAALQAKIVAANAAYIEAAKSRRGVYIADCYAKSVIVTDAKGTLKNGYAADGLHPSPSLAFEMGVPIARILNTLYPDDFVTVNVGAGALYDAVNNPNGNLMNTNQGAFAGTGGVPQTGVTVGTGLALGWTATRSIGTGMTITANKVVATDNGPEWQEFVIAGAVADGEQLYLTSGSISGSKFASGDPLDCQFEYEIVGAGCSGVIGDILFAGGNIGVWESTYLSNVLQGIRQNGVLKWERVTLPSTVTSAQPRLYIRSLAGASFTIRIRNMDFRKVLP